jgi:hypothetical protein
MGDEKNLGYGSPVLKLPARDKLGQAREKHSGICPIRLCSGLKAALRNVQKRSKTVWKYSMIL